MRILYVVGLMAGIVFTSAASTGPIAAMVIYPWCAHYGGRMSGVQNCGFVSRRQRQLTRAGNGGFCVQNPCVSAVPTAADLCAAHTAVMVYTSLVIIALHVLNWKVVRLHLEVHFIRRDCW